MIILLLILLLYFFHVTMIDYLYNNPTYYQLDAYTYESDDFRSMKLGNLIAESGPIDYDLLTSLMIEHNYDLTDSKDTICHTEGCDIMGTERPRGYYPVVSMSDGVVEKVGWLEKGGWRIGIRAPGGAYLYYAHLYGYSREWQEGDAVKAGELLGFMGDTGYSTVEGTTGNFEVHLHVGIYMKTDHEDEMSINPYWVLKYLQKYRLKYSY